PQSRSFIDATGDLHLERALLLDAAATAALGARVLDHCPGAVAARAGAGDGEEALRETDLAAPAAAGAGFGRRAARAARARAEGAGLEARDAERRFGAERRLLERQ